MKTFRTITGVTLFFLCASFSCSFQSKPSNQAETAEIQLRDTEEAISKYDFLKSLDRLCGEMPIFEDYVIKTKGWGMNQRKFISYFYSSPTKESVNYPKLKDFFIDYFRVNGWQIIEDRDFGSKSLTAQHNDDEVSLYFATDRGMAWGRYYSISCKKISLE